MGAAGVSELRVLAEKLSDKIVAACVPLRVAETMINAERMVLRIIMSVVSYRTFGPAAVEVFATILENRAPDCMRNAAPVNSHGRGGDLIQPETHGNGGPALIW